MLETKNDFLEYIKGISLEADAFSSSKFKKNIEEYSLQSIFLNELMHIGNREYCKALIVNNIQRKRNQKIIQCITRINELAEPMGLKIIYIKGIVLASEFYDPVETRIFGDIDILLDRENFPQLKTIMAKIGYRETDNEQSYHHVQFTRQTTGQQDDIAVPIEAHYAFIGAYPEINMKAILKRAVRKQLFNQSLYILELHDGILFLFIHFARHFKNDFLDSIYDNLGRITVRLTQLYDIALLVDKYRNEIDWRLLFQRITDWELVNEMLLVITHFDKIFGNRIPLSFLKRLRAAFAPGRKTFDFEIFTRLTEMQDCGLNLFAGSLKQNSLFAFLSKAGKNNQRLECSFRNAAPAENSIYMFSINEYIMPGVKKAQTHVSSGIPPASNADCSLRGVLSWDWENLYFQFRVSDDILVLNNEKITNQWWQRDALEVYFINPNRENVKSIISKIIIIPQQTGEQYRISVLNQHGKFLDNTLFTCSFVLTGDGYGLDINIPWQFIKIKPEADMQIPFDIAILDCDDPGKGLKTKLSLYSGGYEPNYDILNYGRLHLI